LPRLIPGDTLVVIRIDSESYKKANVEASMTRTSGLQATPRTAAGEHPRRFSRKPLRSAHNRHPWRDDAGR